MNVTRQETCDHRYDKYANTMEYAVKERGENPTPRDVHMHQATQTNVDECRVSTRKK
jgi:hypothetical protein